MKAMLRYSSAWHDVAAQSEAVTRDGLDSRHFLLCGDDSHAGTLVDDGHMDRAIRHAIDEGLPPMTAIQMATINTAEHFGLSREIGMIAPGRQADLLLVKDLANFRPELVLVGGQLAVSRGQVLIELPAQKFPAWLTHSVRLKQPLMAEDFRLRTEVKAGRVKCNVIGVIENQAPTRHLHRNLPVKDGQVLLEEDVAKVAVVERHHASGIVQLGLVSGFGLGGNCGIASTVAHDCHHMLVIGTSEADMALAANTLARSGGGQVVVKDGIVIGEIELAIGGLMSTGQAEQVARKAETILAGFRQCGCRLNNANMTMSLLALVVIPELRISDRGLVDVRRQAFIPVFENPES
jgi:adenine deaminase